MFRNRKCAELDAAAYAEAARRMEQRARVQPGYLGFKSYVAADGEVIAFSEWTDEAAARAWGRSAEQLATQARGRGEWYQDYTLLAGEATRVHRYERPA